MLHFIYNRTLNVMPDNFLLLLEAALFFGVENLLLECETWFRYATSARELRAREMPLETIIEIWKFGWEHGIIFVRELCEGYLARHFVGMGDIM